MDVMLRTLTVITVEGSSIFDSMGFVGKSWANRHPGQNMQEKNRYPRGVSSLMPMTCGLYIWLSHHRISSWHRGGKYWM
jgi:hypothetical protein